MPILRGLLSVLAILVFPAGVRCAWADTTFESNGVKINYSIKGKGEPVILIHGWLSSGWINWDLPGTTYLLAKDHQVVWLDIPAHGRSDKPTTDDAYGPELVEHVIRLMDHLKIKKAHVVGYSMGGIITAKLMAEHPDRVLSGTLGGMGWLREGSVEQKVFANGGRDGKPAGICFLRTRSQTISVRRTSSPSSLGSDGLEVRRRNREVNSERVLSLAKLALTEDEIKSIKVPVVILFGDRDFIRKGYVEPLERVRKDWPVIDIKDADHITCILKPQFREEIQKWLAEHSQR